MSHSNFISMLLKHKLIVGSLALVAIIAVGSGIFYVVQTQKPAAVQLPNAGVGSLGPITTSGTVEPLENPNLSFESAGRVAYVDVAVGDKVFTGQTLASLDIAVLVAQRAQAVASEKAQQAKLDALNAGPRQTDLAVRQAALSQSEQTLANAYANLPSAISDAYAKAFDAVRSQTDPLFSNPNTASPTLIFQTANSSTAGLVVAARVNAGGELTLWSNELAGLSTSPSNTELDTALNAAIAHLIVIRQFDDTVISALAVAVPTTSFPASAITSAQATVTLARANVNNVISLLIDKKQALISDRIAIQSAQAQLDQLNAGATTQDIAAQEAVVEQAAATVRGIDAQIAHNVISAPFSGTVASISVKAGELATPNVSAITLLPDSALEVAVYVTEIDMTHIRKGDVASITLDAYGNGKSFPAHVSIIDAAPTNNNGISAYKVTLVFDTPDASIRTGMTANATITPSAQ